MCCSVRIAHSCWRGEGRRSGTSGRVCWPLPPNSFLPQGNLGSQQVQALGSRPGSRSCSAKDDGCHPAWVALYTQLYGNTKCCIFYYLAQKMKDKIKILITYYYLIFFQNSVRYLGKYLNIIHHLWFKINSKCRLSTFSCLH